MVIKCMVHLDFAFPVYNYVKSSTKPKVLMYRNAQVGDVVLHALMYVCMYVCA